MTYSSHWQMWGFLALESGIIKEHQLDGRYLAIDD